MEQQQKRSVIVGAFVFLALVIFVLGIMTLGGQKSLFNRGAKVHTFFSEVNGLQAGNNVWYAGVKVGTVQAIAFEPDGRVKVSMNISEDYLNVVKRDVKAKVGSDGFIGNKLVVLSGGTAGAPVVQDGTVLASETAVGMEAMMATLQENNKNLLTITDNFKTLSNQLVSGQGTVGKLLKDEQLFNDLQQSLTTIRAASTNAQQMLLQVSDYTAKLTNKGSLANDLVTDTVIFSRLRSTVREIDALSNRAQGVVTSLTETSNNLQQKLNDKSGPAGLLLNDEETAADIRATIKNLQAGTQKLDENMEALQHNFLLRGFFRKRQKQQEEAQREH